MNDPTAFIRHMSRAARRAISVPGMRLDKRPTGTVASRLASANIEAAAIAFATAPGEVTTAIFFPGTHAPDNMRRAADLNWRILTVSIDNDKAEAAAQADWKAHSLGHAVVYVCQNFVLCAPPPAEPSPRALAVIPGLRSSWHERTRDEILRANVAALNRHRAVMPPEPELPAVASGPACGACGGRELVCYGYRFGRLKLCAQCARSYFLHTGSPSDPEAAKLQNQMIDAIMKKNEQERDVCP